MVLLLYMREVPASNLYSGTGSPALVALCRFLRCRVQIGDYNLFFLSISLVTNLPIVRWFIVREIQSICEQTLLIIIPEYSPCP